MGEGKRERRKEKEGMRETERESERERKRGIWNVKERGRMREGEKGEKE